MGPVAGVGKGRAQLVAVARHGSAHVVKMQMRQKHVGNVVAVEPVGRQTPVERRVAVQVVVAEELFVLLGPDARVDEGQAVAVFDEQAAHRPGTQVVRVGGVGALPERLGHDAKHGAPVELEKARFNGVQLHFLRLALKNSVMRSPQSSASMPVVTRVLGCSWPPMVRNPRFSSLAP